MNLKDLENIAGQHANARNISRQSDFEAALNQGLNLLSQAQSEGYQHTETLMQASDTLIDAISLSRSDTRPYLALAYLFSILEDFRTAEEYAYAAIKIEPQNHELADFLAKIQTFKKQVATSTSVDAFEIAVPEMTAPSETAPNYQKLYSDLEVFILDKLKHLFSTSHAQIEPTVNPQKYKILLKSYKNLNQVIKYMEQQLDVIAKSLNVSALKEKMMPFQLLKNRHVKALKTSKQLMEIHDTIELWSFKTDKQVQVVNQNLTMSALTYGRVDVDRMMDGCDFIADQLDQLSEDENIDISLVENSYEKLLGLVESLNNMVDDAGATQQNASKLSDILG